MTKKRFTTFDDLLDDALARHRLGEVVDIQELGASYPEFAEDIRSLLPSILLLEGAKPEPESQKATEEKLDQIGGYQIVRKIGKGGMGVVYEAEHTSLGRRAAVKVLPQRLAADPAALQRFEHEGRAIAKMHHSNIVPLYEVGEDNGRFFLAMQLIEGSSLDVLIKDLSKRGRSWTGNSSGVSPENSIASKNQTDSEGLKSCDSSYGDQRSWTGNSSGASPENSIASKNQTDSESLKSCDSSYGGQRSWTGNSSGVSPENSIASENQTDSESLKSCDSSYGGQRSWTGNSSGVSPENSIASKNQTDSESLKSCDSSYGEQRSWTGNSSGVSPENSIASENQTDSESLKSCDSSYGGQRSWTGNSSGVSPENSIASKNQTDSESLKSCDSSYGDQRSWTGNSSGVSPENSIASSNRGKSFFWIATIGAQVADALHYAHRRGFIHRDVKPSNLLLDESGVAWLTDFGLAKTDDNNMTQTGQYVGTLRYMSPERFRGLCDERADIYGLGLTLYELLLLKPAFESSDRVKIINQIQNEEPARPRSIDRQIPKDLETIVLKAIEKDPRQRYASAKEMAEDLTSFVNDLPIKARRLSIAEQFVRWTRRNKKIAAALSLAAASLILLAVASWFNARTQNAFRVIAENATSASERKSDQLQESLYFAKMNIASVSASEPYGVNTVKASLDEWLPNRVGRDMRGWEWHYLYSLGHQADFVSDRQAYWIWEIAHHPNNDTFVNLVSGYGLQFRDAKTGKLLREKLTGSCRSVDFSPDGSKLLYSDFRGDIYILDAATLEPIVEILHEDDRQISCVRWSPDGTRFASCNGHQKGIVIWDATTGEQLKLLGSDSPSRFGELVWHPDGQKIAGISNRTVRVWDIAGEKQLWKHEYEKYCHSLSWNCDGSMIAFGNEGCDIWDWQKDKHVATIDLAEAYSIDWHPTQPRVLACGGYYGVVRVVDVVSKRIAREFYGHSSSLLTVSWSMDGSTIASAGKDAHVKIWNMQRPQAHAVIPYYKDIEALVWCKDDQSFVAGFRNDGVGIFNVDTKQKKYLRFSGSVPVEGTYDGIPRATELAATDDGWRVAIGGWMKGIVLFDLKTNEFRLVGETSGSTGGVAWSPTGHLAALSVSDSKLTIWDAAGDRLLETVSLHDSTGLDVSETHDVHWHPKQNWIATCADDDYIRVWDIGDLRSRTGRSRTGRSWTGNSSVEPPKDSAQSKDLAQSNGDPQSNAPEVLRLQLHRDPEVLRLQLRPKLLWEQSTSDLPVRSIRFSHDGKYLASAHDGAIAIWSAESGKRIRLLDSLRENFSAIDWSPDDHRLAAGSKSSLSVWDTESGRVTIKLPRASSLVAVGWSSDGRRLVGSSFSHVYLYDATIGYEEAK